jgi:hypothetical protein
MAIASEFIVESPNNALIFRRAVDDSREELSFLTHSVNAAPGVRAGKKIRDSPDAIASRRSLNVLRDDGRKLNGHAAVAGCTKRIEQRR